MKLAGAAWVNQSGYRMAFHPESGSTQQARELYRRLDDEAFMKKNTGAVRKLDAVNLRAFYAMAFALYDARTAWKSETALTGTGGAECTHANEAYYSDYVQYGRKLGRANLFIYTLPTSPLAEAAIHFGLQGPLYYSASIGQPFKHMINQAQMLLNDGVPAVLSLWQEVAESAAVFFCPDTGGDADRMLREGVQTPEMLFNRIKEMA